MNLPRYIQPVVEGDTRGALSPSIYKPIAALARAILNIQGRNCDVYISDQRLVVDLINSTRGPNGQNPNDNAPDDRPKPYPEPAGGWDGGSEPRPAGAPAVLTWSASKYARHSKRGFYPFSDYRYETEPYTKPSITQPISYTQYVSGTHYLTMNFSRSGSFMEIRQNWDFPGAANFYIELQDVDFGGAGLSNNLAITPPSAGGTSRIVVDPVQAGVAGISFAHITRRGYGYWLQNVSRPTDTTILDTVVMPFWLGETPQDATAEITLNRYATPTSINNLYFYNGGVFDFIDRNGWIPHVKGDLVIDQGLNGNSTSYNWQGCIVTLDNHYTTRLLHTDVYNLLMSADFTASSALNFEFVQPTGGSQTTSTPTSSDVTTQTNGPGSGLIMTFYDTIPEVESEYSTPNQNVITTSVSTEPSWVSYGANIFYGAMHFRRKALNIDGSFAEPLGYVVDLERRKVMLGNHATVYVGLFRVPTEHLAPRFPSVQMPASAEFVSVTAHSIGVGSELTLTSDNSPMYSVWATSNLAGLQTPPTPVVYTSGGNAPTISKSGLDVTYTIYHGEPYLRFKIYRNTVNDSATATEVADVVDIFNSETSDQVFRGVHVDTVPGAGTYYYWHKAYWDVSRISGFSAVKSISV